MWNSGISIKIASFSGNRVEPPVKSHDDGKFDEAQNRFLYISGHMRGHFDSKLQILLDEVAVNKIEMGNAEKTEKEKCVECSSTGAQDFEWVRSRHCSGNGFADCKR